MIFKARLYKEEKEPCLEFFNLDKLISGLNTVTSQNSSIDKAKRFMSQRLYIPNIMRNLKVEALGCYILALYTNKNDRGNSRAIGSIGIVKRCDIREDYRIETVILSMPFIFPERDLMNYKVKVSKSRTGFNDPTDVVREDSAYYDKSWESTNIEKYIPTKWFLTA